MGTNVEYEKPLADVIQFVDGCVNLVAYKDIAPLHIRVLLKAAKDNTRLAEQLSQSVAEEFNLQKQNLRLENAIRIQGETVKALNAQVAGLIETAGRYTDELSRLNDLINSPQVDDFLEAVRTEAAHQVERWGYAHDRSKSSENWFWLVGYLAGKALRSSITGGKFKALHHTISSAAALKNWHDAITHDTTGAGIGQDADLAPDNPIDAQCAKDAESIKPLPLSSIVHREPHPYQD